jgi:hypothetical protein
MRRLLPTGPQADAQAGHEKKDGPKPGDFHAPLVVVPIVAGLKKS